MKNFLMRSNRLVFALLLVGTPVALAKGLDEIKPTEEAEKPTPTESVTPDGGAAVASPQPSASPVPDAKPGEAKAEVAAEKKIEPSESSKAIADKLAVSSSIGWVRILTASDGEFHAGGLADLALLWNFSDSKTQNLNILGSFRYASIDVDAIIDDEARRGVIEGYHLGAILSYKTSESFAWLGSFELVYYKGHMRSLERGDYLVTGGAAATLGLGGDWFAMEKFKFGPRLYMGFGSYSTAQFGVGATLVF